MWLLLVHILIVQAVNVKHNYFQFYHLKSGGDHLVPVSIGGDGRVSRGR